MSEATVDVISELSDTGHPKLGNCTLMLGDATHTVEFVNGRARVTPETAELLVGRTDLIVVGYQPGTVEPAPTAADTPQEVEFSDTTAQPPSDEEMALRREEARKQLAAEGADVPPFPIPNGFATHTGDDEHRCLAAKADGSQCSNAAKDNGWACGLGPHQDQVAELSTT